MHRIKVITYKFLINILLRLPDAFYAILFTVVFPVYKALHKKRAFGRVEKHLAAAKDFARKMRAESSNKPEICNNTTRDAKSPTPNS